MKLNQGSLSKVLLMLKTGKAVAACPSLSAPQHLPYEKHDSSETSAWSQSWYCRICRYGAPVLMVWGSLGCGCFRFDLANAPLELPGKHPSPHQWRMWHLLHQYRLHQCHSWIGKAPLEVWWRPSSSVSERNGDGDGCGDGTEWW